MIGLQKDFSFLVYDLLLFKDGACCEQLKNLRLSERCQLALLNIQIVFFKKENRILTKKGKWIYPSPTEPIFQLFCFLYRSSVVPQRIYRFLSFQSQKLISSSCLQSAVNRLFIKGASHRFWPSGWQLMVTPQNCEWRWLVPRRAHRRDAFALNLASLGMNLWPPSLASFLLFVFTPELLPGQTRESYACPHLWQSR